MTHRLFLLSFFLFAYGNFFGQGLQVLITEEKNGKRVELFAENKTSDTLNVFFLIKAEGYRRSAAKPILKDLPPNSKVPMTTLIELDGETSQYTYDLIINKERKDISIKFTPEARDIRSIVQDRLVLFVAPGCDKCTALSEALTEKRITHKAFDIHQDPTMYRQFMSFIERMLTSETKIKFPVIWNNDYVIFGYDELETIVDELENNN